MPKPISAVGYRQYEVVTDDKKLVISGQVRESEKFKDRELGDDVMGNLTKILNSQTSAQEYIAKALAPHSKFLLHRDSGEIHKLYAKSSENLEDINKMWKQFNKLHAVEKPEVETPVTEPAPEAEDEKVKNLIRAAIKYIEKKLEL